MKYEGLRALTTGTAAGEIALLTMPISLWGGLNFDDGTICDATHPEHGLSLRGKILVMRSARGSSSSSSALVEAARRGNAPAAIVLGRPDPILGIGSLVAADLYGIHLPILIFPESEWDCIPAHGTGQVQADDAGATIEFLRSV